jgi:hypothetical protein
MSLYLLFMSVNFLCFTVYQYQLSCCFPTAILRYCSNKASTFTSSVQDSSESMAKAKALRRKQTAFFKELTNVAPLAAAAPGYC